MLIMAVVISLSACAGEKIPLHTAVDTLRSTTGGNLQHSYTVTFNDGNTYYLDDDDIDVRGDTIGIRFEGQEGYRYYRPDQFREIRYKTEKHTWLGGGIGAAAGAALGVGIGLIIQPPNKNCSNAGDPDDCETFKTLVPLALSVLGTTVGFGTGAGIGSGIPKKKKININVSPKVYGIENQTVNGGGVSISGRF